MLPPLKGIFGSITELTDGRKITVDEEYLKDKIRNPAATTKKGYQPGMMAGALATQSFTDEEIEALVAYITSLK